MILLFVLFDLGGFWFLVFGICISDVWVWLVVCLFDFLNCYVYDYPVVY